MRKHPELSVPERRRFGKSAETRDQALRRFRAGESVTDLARWLDLDPIQVRYMLMQERVEEGEVRAVATNPTAIAAALQAGGEFGTAPWVACRAGVTEYYVRRHSPPRRPSNQSNGSPLSSAREGGGERGPGVGGQPPGRAFGRARRRRVEWRRCSLAPMIYQR